MTQTDPYSQAPGDALDADTLQQLVDLDDGSLGLVKEMLEIFRDDTPLRIDALDEAVKANNREAMGDVAHAIKGASATIGAPKVRAIALALEMAGRKGVSEEEPQVLVVRLREEFQRALDALSAFIAARS